MKQEVLDNELYQKAERFRNSFAHRLGPSSVSETYTVKRNKEVEFTEVQEDGTVKKIKRIATVLSCRAGDYTYANDIVENILDFSAFTGSKIKNLLNKMINE